MNRKKALITGGTGFIGAHLVKRLVADGWDAHVIIRPGSRMDSLGEIVNKFTVHEHNGTTEGMFEIVKESSPHVVFHLASLFLAQHQANDIEQMVNSNILFATQLVEAMTAQGVYKLINTGTSWQHYENRNYSPVNLYAATKQAYESILQFYIETNHLKVITLKLHDTYGPNDPRSKLFTLLRKVAKEQVSLAMSPGEQLLDLVFIDDVVDAFMIAADRIDTNDVHQHGIYSVSSGKPIKLRELVSTYCKIIGKSLPIEWGGKPYRKREVMSPWNNGEWLAGWRPKVELEEGIRKTENSCSVTLELN